MLVLLVALGLQPPLLAQDQGGPAVTASAAERSSTHAPAADEALLARIADLEAYINNAAPKGLVNVPGPGHNAFMMICAALVLFMTLPGLALFYGGLVRTKNVLSVMAQCLGCAGWISILWWAFGYSLAFDTGSPLFGRLTFAFLNDVGAAPNSNYAAWVSQNVFAMYQMMFAIIMPALIVGAIHGMDFSWQPNRPGFLLRCRGGLGRHHSRGRLRQCNRRRRDRSSGWRYPLCCMHASQKLAEVRRRPLIPSACMAWAVPWGP